MGVYLAETVVAMRDSVTDFFSVPDAADATELSPSVGSTLPGDYVTVSDTSQDDFFAPVDGGGGVSAGQRGLMSTDLPSVGAGALQALDDTDEDLDVEYMEGPRTLPMVGFIHSPNCGFTINVTVSALIVDRERVERKAMQYSMLVRCGCVSRGDVGD